MAYNTVSPSQQGYSMSEHGIGLVSQLPGLIDGQFGCQGHQQVFGFFHESTQTFFYCQSREELEAIQEILKNQEGSETNQATEKDWSMFQDVFDDIRLSGPHSDPVLHLYED